jgi:hypothetical protein
MKLGEALPPAQQEAMRQAAYAREFSLALKQRRRIFYAKMKRAQLRKKVPRVARES